MKTITLSFSYIQTKKFIIPKNGKWKKFFDAWLKEENERTNEDWNILEENSFEDFIAEQLKLKIADNNYIDNVDIIDCK